MLCNLGEGINFHDNCCREKGEATFIVYKISAQYGEQFSNKCYMFKSDFTHSDIILNLHYLLQNKHYSIIFFNDYKKMFNLLL